MSTYLLTWNPKKVKWDFDSYYKEACKQGYVDERWSCGVTKRITNGDRVFLLRQGIEPRGILAAGYAVSSVEEDGHYIDPEKNALYVWVRFERLLQPTEMLSRKSLESHLRDVNWIPQASGMSIPSPADEELEVLWRSHLESLGIKSLSRVDEVLEEKYIEGSSHESMNTELGDDKLRESIGNIEPKKIAAEVTQYQRDPQVKAWILKMANGKCEGCQSPAPFAGFDGLPYLEIHHVRQLSNGGQDTTGNTVALCPNCHAEIHYGENSSLLIQNLYDRIIRLKG